MKSIPEKFVSPGAMLCLAMMAVILVHTGDRSVHAQDVIPPAFDAAVPSAVDDGSHVEQVDFQPMEIPQEDLADRRRKVRLPVTSRLTRTSVFRMNCSPNWKKRKLRITALRPEFVSISPIWI